MPKGRFAVPFASYIHFGPDCWEWMGGRNSQGYGNYFDVDKRKTVKAHRYAYEMVNGPIAQGMDLCHKCDNPKCVRHDHLFVGTRSDNVIDSVKKKRHMNSKKTHCMRGHELAGDNLYVKPSTGARRCRTCTKNDYLVKKYGTSISV